MNVSKKNLSVVRVASMAGLLACGALSSQAAIQLDFKFADGSNAMNLTAADLGTAKTFEVWATVIGADENYANDGLQALYFGAASSKTEGAAFGGALTVGLANPFTTLVIPSSAASDFNGDGIGDLGNVTLTASNAAYSTYIGARAASIQEGTASSVATFKLADITFNIAADLLAGNASGGKTVFSPYISTNKAASIMTWKEDGAAKNNRTAGVTFINGSTVSFVLDGGTPPKTPYDMTSESGLTKQTVAIIKGGMPSGNNDKPIVSWSEDDGSAVFGPGFGPKPRIISDVLDLTGTEPDVIVLQMTYDQAGIPDEAESARQGHIMIATKDDAGVWVPTIGLNTGESTPQMFLGAWDGVDMQLGHWGVDISTNTVWAVINHNSKFAVVPEPASLSLLGLSALGLLARRRKA